MQEYGVGQFWGKLREEVLVGGHESYIAKGIMRNKKNCTISFMQ